MSVRTCTFEGGTNGASIPTSAAGASSAFSVSSSGLVYSTERPAHGTVGGKIPGGATGTQNWVWTQDAGDSCFVRCYANFDANGTEISIFQIRHASGNALRLFKTTAGTIRMSDPGSSNRATSSMAVSPDTTYRFEAWCKGSAAGAGEGRFAVYLGDSTTPLYESALATGLTNQAITEVRYGSIGTAIDTWWDDLGYKSGADAVYGPWVPAAPALDPDPDPPVLGIVRRLDFTGSAAGAGGTLPVVASVAQVSGPDITATLAAVSGTGSLVWSFVDDLERADDIVLTWQLEDAASGASDPATVTIGPGGTPVVRRVGGPLVWDPGDETWR
ncbi:hypothetical protein [Cellulomonas composti]|uniref:Uncharacterized protein n=1 Tax=Cellulomonas composti TaxID=266130 RepID=A0A511JBK7_9CELL|nr:hypothetical protein [Cellulomonas composti]GEL95344.1 hypothetical protein CCO02nite_20020 [Cellulomonas composti]